MRASWTFFGVILACAVLVCGAGGAARAQDASTVFPVITGEHWQKATQQEKLAFIAGMATIIELEKEVQGDVPPAGGKSLIPGWVKGLSPLKLKEIVAALDDYFTKEPTRTDRPLVEVLWVEVATPNLKKQ